MSNTLNIGLVGTATTTVTKANIAATMKSGSLAVFATPAMCALMEEAACAAVNAYLEAGSGTVGISLNITHELLLPGLIIVATGQANQLHGIWAFFDAHIGIVLHLNDIFTVAGQHHFLAAGHRLQLYSIR